MADFMEMLAPLVAVFLIGMFVLLFPISRRLAKAMEEWIRLRREASPEQARLADVESELRDVRQLLETVDQRLELLSERQSFTESLLEAKSAERLPSGS